ncbi:DUF397 domain-containing protein [Streptomyces sp. NPDC001404]|uniref:DUF397 domain-containing protein n=1 Tax=Streptomyces sp. NPDC001404 TaxID=3364571 RepID=UPI0036946B0E
MRADLSNANWRKSSYSTGQEECVEVAENISGEAVTAIRDSKRPSGPALLLPRQAWARFVRTL